jgi:hypothetical protein
MRLLIKFPSRQRPTQFISTLKLYVSKCNQASLTDFLITLDEDDETMTPLHNEISAILANHKHQIIYGKSDNKIHAINRDMKFASNWDILLLASDDMLPKVQGYDDIIREKMNREKDRVLWFNDGYAGDKLNTLVCMGYNYYKLDGYIYNPAYKSFFCDNEFMEKATQRKKQIYFPECIIGHEHPANTGETADALYKHNDKYWNDDENYYLHSKTYDYDLSVLICSLEERRPMLEGLLKELNFFKTFSTLNIEILTDVDNREKSIGQKRNDLVARAKGKYCCFIDDDDQVSKYYFSEIEEALKDKPDCVALLGMFYENGRPVKPFVHSIDTEKYMEDEEAFYRPPNHLNPILTGLVKRVGFPTKNFGEDTDFAMRMVGLLKTQGLVRTLIYHYFFVRHK